MPDLIKKKNWCNNHNLLKRGHLGEFKRFCKPVDTVMRQTIIHYVIIVTIIMNNNNLFIDIVGVVCNKATLDWSNSTRLGKSVTFQIIKIIIRSSSRSSGSTEMLFLSLILINNREKNGTGNVTSLEFKSAHTQ